MDLHTILAELPVKAFITNNFDSLLESSLLNLGKAPNVVLTDDQLKYLREEKPLIIKLYGSVDFPDSLLLSEFDYEKMRSKRVTLFNYIQGLLSSGITLFIGFPLYSDRLQSLYEEFYSPTASIWVALIVRENILHEHLWKNRGVNIIAYHNNAEMISNLRWLGAKLKKKMKFPHV